MLKNNIISRNSKFCGNTIVCSQIQWDKLEKPKPLGFNFIIEIIK